MSDKLFRRIIAALTAIGCTSTILLVLYTILMYSDCSIISFIANGR